MSIKVSGGGGGGASYPGVTSDGTNGLLIQHDLSAGDPAAVGGADNITFNGAVLVSDTQGSIDNAQDSVTVAQQQALTENNDNDAFVVTRTGTLNGFKYTHAAYSVIDTTSQADSPPYRAYSKVVPGHTGAVTMALDTGPQGGIGRFGHAAPVAASAITGALSTVTDAAAKAVLTSIIAALTADGGATDGTT